MLPTVLLLSDEKTVNMNAKEEQDPKNFHDAETGVEFDVVDKMPLLEWLANNYKTFGADLEFISDRSQEGSQFCKGFGGIGGEFMLFLVCLLYPL